MTLPGSLLSIKRQRVAGVSSDRQWCTGMHAVFLICLVGGLGTTALLALFGGLAGHVGGHGLSHVHAAHPATHVAAPQGHLALPGGHAGLATHGAPAHTAPVAGPHAHADVATTAHGLPGAAPTAGSVLLAAAGWSLSWLSPFSLAAAAMWFGAGGLLAELAVPALSVLIAVIAGLVGAGIVRALLTAFARASSEPLSATAIGAVGVLNARIQPGAVGEVVYDLEGLHRSLPARSEDGSSIPRGADVVIVRCEQGIAYVNALDPLSALTWPDGAAGEAETAAGSRPDS